MVGKLLSICQRVNPDIPTDTKVKLFDRGFLDSFGAYTLLVEIELEFDIRIPDEEIMYENFMDMDSIAALVHRYAYTEEA